MNETQKGESIRVAYGDDPCLIGALGGAWIQRAEPAQRFFMSLLEESLGRLDDRDDGSLKDLCESLFHIEEIPLVLHYVQTTAHILCGRHDDMVGIDASGRDAFLETVEIGSVPMNEDEAVGMAVSHTMELLSGIGGADESDLAMALAVSCQAVVRSAGWDAGEYARLFVRAWHRLNVDLWRKVLDAVLFLDLLEAVEALIRAVVAA